MTVSQTGSAETVLAFGRAWERRDPDEIVGFLATDVVYQNVPAPAISGRDSVRAFISPSLFAVDEMNWEFLSICAAHNGRRVLTERVDRFVFPTGTIEVPLMGIFELSDGLITHWRDYTDLGRFMDQMKAIGRPVNPALLGSENSA